MVSKSSGESETFARSGIGEIKDGVTVQAPPPSFISASGFAGVLLPRRTSPSVAVRGQTTYDTAQFAVATASTALNFPARYDAIAESAHVVNYRGEDDGDDDNGGGDGGNFYTDKSEY